ncbi:putative catabolic 3-dehydroquinase [Rosellinia necatrix]|uniref:Putative catabolic 3-dehydroquinase n=1 Tax=Rosellinia necatrix TaxID=77044 RepID=A0A1W2TKR6_ROSNE|nr:putative catabolic 3-dehydroquinase [Rosellinia necatrix]
MTSPSDPQKGTYHHINGNPGDILDRLAVSELCKGWPVYRDASEWKNFRSLFCQDAFVWTTWSKRQTIDGFIKVSKEGKSRGDFIMHRECGTSVDLNPHTRRAVGKMKATITQRFVIPGDAKRGVESVFFDVDCDCRFHFFCLEQPGSDGSEWKVRYVKLIYDKDKVVPVDGKTAPVFSQEALQRYPKGYQYLGAAQHMLGHDVDEHLPTVQAAELGTENPLWLDMYDKMGQWLGGDDDIDLSSPIPSSKGVAVDGETHSNGSTNGNGGGSN